MIDPEEHKSILVVGGDQGSGDNYKYVEMIGDKKCALPQLPYATEASQVILTNNNDILTCGGYGDNIRKCLVLNTKEVKWVAHSDMNKERKYFASVTMPSAVYIMGGSYSKTTSEFLPSGSTNWQNGPSIPAPGLYYGGCAVKKNDFEIILIGGSDTQKRIIQLNIQTNKWITLGELQEGRIYHACAVIDNTIVVTGGRNSNARAISSTEVISLRNQTLSELVGDLNDRRLLHGMAIAHVNGKPTLLAFGGESVNDIKLDSIELWIPESQSWAVLSDTKLSEAKDLFGYLSVPTQLICP